MTIQKKVCLLGDFAVGKTSLVRRYVEGRFDDKYLSTIGVKISRKTVQRGADSLTLLLWDLAGGDDFRQVGTSYLRGAAGALLVCDLTRADTLPVILKYLEQLRALSPQAAMVLVGNKVDLTAERGLTEQAIQAVTTSHQIPYLLTSAKTGSNVEEAFQLLAERIKG